MVAPVSKCEPAMTLRPEMAPLNSLDRGISAVEQRRRTQTYFAVGRPKRWKTAGEAEAVFGKREPRACQRRTAEVGQPQPITFGSLTPIDLILLMSFRYSYNHHC